MATKKNKQRKPVNDLVQAPETLSRTQRDEKEYGQAVKIFAQAEKENAYSGYSRRVKTV